jgi:hypothetical protein
MLLGFSTTTGWWFGTMDFYDFPFRKGNVIIPTDELIFFRGVGLNHQPDNKIDESTELINIEFRSE